MNKIINEYHAALQREAEALFTKGLKREAVWVYFDPDVDGCLAGYLVWEYLKRVHNVDARVMMNDNRAHGCFYKPEMKGSFIINVDSGMTEEDLDAFTKEDCLVLSLDHHKLPLHESWALRSLDKEGKVAGLVYNSDYPFLEARYGYLSGAGVVDLFFDLYDKDFKTNLTDAYVGITLLSDARPIENEYARKTLENTYNLNILDIPFIKVNWDKMLNTTYDSPHSKLDRNFIDFKLSPFINAALRCNANKKLLNSLLYEQKCPNYRPVQKEAMQELTNALHRVEFHSYILLVADRVSAHCDTKLDTNLIGLIANRVLNETGKTILILYKADGALSRGSVRGKFHTINYLDIFQSHGFSVAGHPGAFGVLAIDKRVNLQALDQSLTIAEASHEPTNEVINIPNLLTYAGQTRTIAYENQFVRPLYKKYLRYTGLGAVCTTQRTNYVVYSIDGVQVKGFDETLDVKEDLILPVYNNMLVDYILEKKVL